MDFEKVFFWKIKSNISVYDRVTMISFAKECLEVTWDIRECFRMIFECGTHIDELESEKIAKKGQKSTYVWFRAHCSKEIRLKNDEKNFFLEFLKTFLEVIRHVLWYLNTFFSTLKVSKDRIGGEKPKYSCAKEMYHFSIFVLCSMIQRSIMKIVKMDF